MLIAICMECIAPCNMNSLQCNNKIVFPILRDKFHLNGALYLSLGNSPRDEVGSVVMVTMLSATLSATAPVREAPL